MKKRNSPNRLQIKDVQTTPPVRNNHTASRHRHRLVRSRYRRIVYLSGACITLLVLAVLWLMGSAHGVTEPSFGDSTLPLPPEVQARLQREQRRPSFSSPTSANAADSDNGDTNDANAAGSGSRSGSKDDSISAPGSASGDKSGTKGQIDYPHKVFPEKELPILHAPRTSVHAMQAFAKSRNAAPIFVKLAPKFFTLATKAGVDPLVAYCQAALETNFMHFTGVVTADHHNPCGLKTTVGGGDKEKAAHTVFPDWDTGIRAQVEHLALYAGAEGYPLEPAQTADPRHFAYLRGKAPMVEDLGRRWAPAANYGQLIRGLMEQANSFN